MNKHGRRGACDSTFVLSILDNHLKRIGDRIKIGFGRIRKERLLVLRYRNRLENHFGMHHRFIRDHIIDLLDRNVSKQIDKQKIDHIG